MPDERRWKISKGAGGIFISGPNTTDGNGDPGYVEVVPESDSLPEALIREFQNALEGVIISTDDPAAARRLDEAEDELTRIKKERSRRGDQREEWRQRAIRAESELEAVKSERDKLQRRLDRQVHIEDIGKPEHEGWGEYTEK